MKKETEQFRLAHNLTGDQFYGREKVGGSLYLSGLTAVPEGFNPTVGGSLDLSGLTSIPEGFNPTVGGSLDLSGLTAVPEGFNPTVGGSLYLSGGRRYIGNDTGMLSWQDGRYVLIDGIIGEVVAKKKTYWKLKKIGKDETFYAATDDKNHYAHGATLKKANEDLRYKIAVEKIKNEPINADTLITVAYYRALTGACEMGVAQFREAHGMDRESYTARELLPILEKHNAYGLENFRKLAAF